MSMSDHVATVWIDNPPVNAISPTVAVELEAQLRAVDPRTRVVVLRGRGARGFSAGADLTRISTGVEPGSIQSLARVVETLAQPVVAAIHGFCLGGGLELALACDLRVAQRDARFGLPEVGLGLIPGGGGTQRAPRLIGPGRAAWLILSGQRLSAAQAEAWGLVEFAVDDLDAGLAEITAAIAAASPAAVARAKELLRTTRDRRSDEAELAAFAACLASEDGREGVAAFLAKRPPAWREREPD